MKASSSRLLLRLAWRNLGRNRRRTIITGAAIVLGVGLCIAISGLVDGLDADIIASVTDVDLGDVQLHRPGYLERRSLSLTVDGGARVARAAERQPGVTAAVARAYAWGFATHGGRSLGVQLVGIEPKHEARVTRLEKDIQAGAFLPDAPTPWPTPSALTSAQQSLDASLTSRARDEALAQIEALGAPAAPAAPAAPGAPGAPGAPSPAARGAGDEEARAETQALLRQQSPAPDAPLPVLLGDRLAKRLRAGVGDAMTAVTQDTRGTSVDVDVRVIGVFHTGDDTLDQGRLVFQLTDLQHLLALGDGVHEIAVHVRSRDQAGDVAHRLAGDPAFAGLAVASWNELRPDLLAMVAADDVLTELIVGVVFVLAGLGVVSAMLMAVLERQREFGVLRALGLEPGSLLAMVAIETLFLSTASAAAGVFVGAALDLYLAHHGLDIRSIGRFSLAGVAFDPVLHAAVTPRGVLLPVVVMLAVAALGSIFPAVVAARVQPAVGMRDA